VARAGRAGCCADGVEALRLLEQQRPDILFLDIQMPGASGQEVARAAAGRCHIVFVTAFDQHAVAAFEQGAIDYVLKPVLPSRLFSTVCRLKERLKSGPIESEAVEAVIGQLAMAVVGASDAALDQRVGGPEPARDHGR